MSKPGTFQKGNKIGVGNPGAHRHSMITQVIISQLHEVDSKTSKEKIHMLVDRLVEHALGYTKEVKQDGKRIKVEVPSDLAAIREVIDRVQGKAAQAVTVDAKVVHSTEQEQHDAYNSFAGTLDKAATISAAIPDGPRRLDS